MHKVMLTNQNKKAVKKEPDRIFRGRLFGNRIAPFSKQCSYCWPGSGPAFDLICVRFWVQGVVGQVRKWKLLEVSV